jgi:hypothetical protein
MKLTISRIDQIAEDVRAFELRDPGGATLHFFISASQWESRHARETIPVSACGEGSHDRSRNATLPERMKAATCHRTGRPRTAGFVAPERNSNHSRGIERRVVHRRMPCARKSAGLGHRIRLRYPPGDRVRAAQGGRAYTLPD